MALRRAHLIRNWCRTADQCVLYTAAVFSRADDNRALPPTLLLLHMHRPRPKRLLRASAIMQQNCPIVRAVLSQLLLIAHILVHFLRVENQVQKHGENPVES